MKDYVVELLNECNDKMKSNIAYIIEQATKIKWSKISFTIGMNPKPSKRPRLCGYRVYVPDAAKNAHFFNKEILPTIKPHILVDTPCKVKLDIYVQTPKSFTKTQKVLAEMKIIRPWVNTGDNDNYEKGVYDMIQPNEKKGYVGILSNDSLIVDNTTSKYYSVNPHYDVTITFMKHIPKTILKILRLGNVFDVD